MGSVAEKLSQNKNRVKHWIALSPVKNMSLLRLSLNAVQKSRNKNKHRGNANRSKQLYTYKNE